MTQEPTKSPRPTVLRSAAIFAVAIGAAATGGIALANTSSGRSSVFDQVATTTTSSAATTTTTPTTTTTVAPSSFVGITPVRVLDTRGPMDGPIGVPKAGPLGPNSSIDVKVAGVGGVPANATSVAINITIDQDATVKSFLTVWPTGQPRPLASANNAEPGLVAANSAIFEVGTGGMLSVFNQLGNVNVIIDVTGYFVANSPTSTTTTTSHP